VPFSPGKVTPRDLNARQWDTFVSQAGIQADNRVKTFTPTWTGFSSAPTGELSYMNFGAIVMIWADSTMFGTSNATAMTITNLPEDIWPSDSRVIPTMVLDVTNPYFGMVNLTTGATMTFSISTVSGSTVSVTSTGFTASGNKGLAAGWLITYSK
jgi:heme/copper-type cytochrome/quinol oxidase subunit 3